MSYFKYEIKVAWVDTFGTTGGSIGTDKEFLYDVVIALVYLVVGSVLDYSISFIDFLVSVGLGGNVRGPLISVLDFKLPTETIDFLSGIVNTVFNDSTLLGVGLEKNSG